MGLFGATHGWGGTKRLPPKNMSQICYNDETHTSSKEEIENI